MMKMMRRVVVIFLYILFFSFFIKSYIYSVQLKDGSNMKNLNGTTQGR